MNIIYNQHGEVIVIEVGGERYSPSAIELLIDKSLLYKKSVEELNGWPDAEKELLKAITILERGIQ